MGVLRGHPLACPPSRGGICTRLVDSLPCHKHTLGLGIKTGCCDDQVIWKQEEENAKVISPRPSGHGGGPGGRDTGGPTNSASSTKACAWREPGASRVRIAESGSTTACPSEGGLLQALCPTGRQCKHCLSGKEAEVSSYPYSRLDRVCGGGGQELLEVDLFRPALGSLHLGT